MNVNASTLAYIYVIIIVLVLSNIVKGNSTQPTLLIHNERIALDFISETDLFFYLPLSDYDLNNENAVTLSIDSNQESINPVIYAKCVSTNLQIADLNQLMPESDSDSEFKLTRRTKTHFILYFKRLNKSAEFLNDYLLLRVKPIKSVLAETISSTLVLSEKAEIIDLLSIPQFSKQSIKIRKQIPKHIVMLSGIVNNNYLVYIDKSKQRIFNGRILNYDLTINQLQSDKQMFCLSYNSDMIKTIELFVDKDDFIVICIEEIKNKMFYKESIRQLKEPFDIQINELNEIVYFVEEKGSGVYWFTLEEKIGKYEYYYRRDFASDTLTTLLPNRDDHLVKKGFELIESEYYVIGIKALSPGISTIHYLSSNDNTIKFTDELMHEEPLLLLQGYSYTILLPTFNFNIAIYSIFIDQSNFVITLMIDNSKYSLQSKGSIIVKSILNHSVHIETLTSNAIINMRYMRAQLFTEITSDAFPISVSNYYYYSLANLQAKSFTFKLDTTVKEIKYSIGIGNRKEHIYPIPKTSIRTEEGIAFMTFTNPYHQYTYLSNKDEQFYFVITIKDDQIAKAKIQTKLVSIPKESYLPINQVSSITTGTIYPLQPNTLNSLSLIIIGVVCLNNLSNKSESLSFSYNKKQIEQSVLASQFNLVDFSDYNPRLDIEYYSSNMRSYETLLLSYSYVDIKEKRSLKELVKYRNSLESKKTNKLNWNAPESIKRFVLYSCLKDSNSSSLNDECYLRQAKGGIIVNDVFQFEFNRSFSSGEYYVNVAAIGHDNDKIQYHFPYNSILIKVSHFWFWFWVGFGSFFALLIVIMAICIMFFKGKQKDIAEEISSIEPFMEKDFKIN